MRIEYFIQGTNETSVVIPKIPTLPKEESRSEIPVIPVIPEVEPPAPSFEEFNQSYDYNDDHNNQYNEFMDENEIPPPPPPFPEEEELPPDYSATMMGMDSTGSGQTEEVFLNDFPPPPPFSPPSQRLNQQQPISLNQPSPLQTPPLQSPQLRSQNTNSEANKSSINTPGLLSRSMDSPNVLSKSMGASPVGNRASLDNFSPPTKGINPTGKAIPNLRETKSFASFTLPTKTVESPVGQRYAPVPTALIRNSMQIPVSSNADKNLFASKLSTYPSRPMSMPPNSNNPKVMMN